MSKENGGPAFPLMGHVIDGTVEPVRLGMTLHDWFAGQALAGLCANPKSWETGLEILADVAKRQADAMLKEREKS